MELISEQTIGTPIQEVSYEASLSVLISTEGSAGEVALTGLGGDAQGGVPSGEPSEEPEVKDSKVVAADEDNSNSSDDQVTEQENSTSDDTQTS